MQFSTVIGQFAYVLCPYHTSDWRLRLRLRLRLLTNQKGAIRFFLIGQESQTQTQT